MTSLPEISLELLRDRVLSEYARFPKSIGRYQIRGELGRGGMGVVYDAVDPALRRPVAIKVIREEILDPKRQERLTRHFEKEMYATSEIFHPNVVSILDAGSFERDGQVHAFYVMERVAGPSLEERLAEKGVLSRNQALKLAASIARGLAAAHDHSIIHRDLKPANVMLPANAPPKIADFGLCGFLSNSGESGSGEFVGSPDYIAPEQIEHKPCTHATDFFSLGVILVRMLTGNTPFSADSLHAHFRRVLEDVPDAIDRIDRDLQPLVNRLLAKRAEDRPGSAIEIAEELEALAQPSDPPESKFAFVRSLSAQKKIGLLLAIFGLLIGAMSVSFGLRNELVALDRYAEAQLHEIENQKDRQRTLIPRLVALVESTTGGSAHRLDEEPGSRIHPQIEELARQFPTLRSDHQFMALSFEIVGAENRVALERTRYNDAIRELNQRLAQLPWRFFARGIEARPFIGSPPNTLESAKLELTRGIEG